jgi:ubiquinone/menaquinone biosynthesis C-methylase UbiE
VPGVGSGDPTVAREESPAMPMPETYKPTHAAAQNAFETIDLDKQPERVPITMDTVFDPETPYEAWLMKMIWTKPWEAMPLLKDWVESLPDFSGAPDNSDVLPPGARAVDPPLHWVKTPIHFTPLTDGRYVRVYLSAGRYFQATTDDSDGVNLLAEIHKDVAPQRVIDLGSSTGGSAFSMARLFPEAGVIGVDLGAHFIRAGRMLAERQGIGNVALYQQNGAATEFESHSFDVVTSCMVMHEMPQAESYKFVDEMLRLAAPGARITVIDAIYDDTEEERQARVARSKGPEPFLAEYVKANIPQYMRERGIEDIQRHTKPGWDRMIWSGRAPVNPN